MRTCVACGKEEEHSKAYGWFKHDLCSVSCLKQLKRKAIRLMRKVKEYERDAR